MISIFRFFIITCMALVCLGGCESEPPKPAKAKIGILNPTPELIDLVEGFKKGLSKLGYAENDSVIYIDDGPVKKTEKFEAAVDRLLQAKVDLVFTVTTPATSKAKKALEGINIPIVFGVAGEPVKSGFVKSLQKPGGNLTGIQARSAGIKGLQWLLKIIPDLKRIYVPYNPDNKVMDISMQHLEKAASKYHIELVVVNVRSREEVLGALDRIPENVQAVWQLPSPFWSLYLDEFVEAALKHKKPLKCHVYTGAEKGALMAYGVRGKALGKQAGRLAYKILQGASPADLPVEQAEFYLTINLKTAAAIGLHIPDNIIKQADTVIR